MVGSVEALLLGLRQLGDHLEALRTRAAKLADKRFMIDFVSMCRRAVAGVLWAPFFFTGVKNIVACKSLLDISIAITLL